MAARAVAVLTALTALLASPSSAFASPASPADVDPAAVHAAPVLPRAHAHLSRRRRALSSSGHSPAIASRQVHDPRRAAARWEKRDEIALARRATPSNVPKICQGTVTGYSQCGGQNWNLDTCCVEGYTCVYDSEYYSQCRPNASSSSSSSSSGTVFNPSSSTQALAASSTTSTRTTSAAPSASSTATTCKGTSTEWGQCGGSGYTGATCCPADSQCIPGAASSSTSTTSQAQSSSTSKVSSSTSTTQVQPSSTSTTQAQPTSMSKASSSTSTTTTTTQAQSSSTSKVSTTTTTTQPPTSAPASSTKVSSSSTITSAAPLQTAPTYGQCGGLGASLALCPSGWYCAVVNDYYYQCLPVSASTLSLSSAPTTTATSFSTVTRSASSTSISSTSSAPSASASANTCPMTNAWAQCDGFLWINTVCCPDGYYCQDQSLWYSQCVPGSSSTSSSAAASSTKASSTSSSSSKASSSAASSTKASSTSTSSAPSATATQICNKGSSGSDGCTPYTVSWSGVTLPAGKTWPDGGHVNFQAIPKSQYKVGQTYINNSGWTPKNFGVHFESLNNQPSGIYIGRNFYDWSQAAAAFPSGYCITWVQIDIYNQHFGEGGQMPICTP
ncbi:hypothetical protein JCM10450v2_007811 [Rhodotorula kratochvilovae]